MDLRIRRIVVELADEAGTVRTQEISPGELWECGPGGSPVRVSKAGKTKDKPREGKAKAKEKAGKEKSGEAKKKEPRPKKPKTDLNDPEKREALFQKILALVAKEPMTARVLSQRLDHDRMQVLAALTQMADDGKLVVSGMGARARYGLPDKLEPEPVAEVAPEVVAPEPIKLMWKRETVGTRETLVSPWEDGRFRLVKLGSGDDALFFERGPSLWDYGCGERKKMKRVARELAGAGLPTPEQYRAAGGDIKACGSPRRLRLGGVELVWRETVEGGRQVCVAATGDGEMKLIESEGGSFVLAFVRDGDSGFDTLGCGSREALEARALDVLAQAEAEAEEMTPEPAAAPKEAPSVAEPKSKPEPESSGTEADEEVSAEKDAAIMDALRSVLQEI